MTPQNLNDFLDENIPDEVLLDDTWTTPFLPDLTKAKDAQCSTDELIEYPE